MGSNEYLSALAQSCHSFMISYLDGVRLGTQVRVSLSGHDFQRIVGGKSVSVQSKTPKNQTYLHFNENKIDKDNDLE